MQEKISSLKVPPHSIMSEQALIGGVFIDNNILVELNGTLTPEMFYRKEHRLMYEAMQMLQQGQAPIDAITLSNILKASNELQEAGGIEYIGEILSAFGSAANALHYASIIRDTYLERQLIGIGHGIADSGYNADGRTVLERLAQAQGALLAIQSGDHVSGPTHIDTAMRAAFKEIDERHIAGTGIAGISTGFKDLDKLIGGLKPAEVVLVAGRPSSGKSTLAQNILEHAVLAGLHSYFFSTEMPERMVTTRHISSVGNIPLEDLISANIFDHSDAMLKVYSKLNGKYYYIDDTPSLISAQILPRAQRMIMKSGKPLDLIVIDYMQRLRDTGQNANARLEEISGNIKHAARVLNCPIVALCQLNRECEKRPNKRPIMSDLRDSGAIEQDADVIAFVYRDEMYNENSDWKGITEIIVGKNRNGKLGRTYLTSRLDYARFENLAGPLPSKIGGKQHYGLD